MKVLFCVLSFWAGVLAAAGPVRTIEDFTADFETAFPVLLAEDNLDASRFARQRVDAANGWKFFANFGGGYVQDIVVTNRTRNFATIGGRIGVEYPLLGSAEEERRGLSEAQKEVDLNSIRLQWIKQQARMQIAEDYALYWGAQQKNNLAQLYYQLKDRVSAILRQRRNKGLLLEADRLEALTAFERVRYAKMDNQDAMQRSLLDLGSLFGREIPVFTAQKPLYAALQTDSLNFIVEEHHEMKILATMLKVEKENLRHQRWRGIESDFKLTHAAIMEDPKAFSGINDLGYGVVARVRVKMPFSIVDYQDADKAHSHVLINQLQRQLVQRRGQLQKEFDTALRRYQRLSEFVQYQQTRVAAAAELLRERELRLRKLDGDVIEKYLQGLYHYYQVAVDYTEAQTEHWQARIKRGQFVSLINVVQAVVDDTELSAPLQRAFNVFNENK